MERQVSTDWGTITLQIISEKEAFNLFSDEHGIYLLALGLGKENCGEVKASRKIQPGKTTEEALTNIQDAIHGVIEECTSHWRTLKMLTTILQDPSDTFPKPLAPR